MPGLVQLPKESLPFLQKIFGPAAEVGEFISEKIRYFRWKSSLKVLRKAEKLAKKHGLNPKAVPYKILVPLIEKSSLEEENSPLIDKWANLLADASLDNGRVQATFVDILASLSSPDVKLLEKFVPINLKTLVRDNWSTPEATLDDKALSSALVIIEAARRQGTLRALSFGCSQMELEHKGDDLPKALNEYFTRMVKAEREFIWIETIEYIENGLDESNFKTAFRQHDIINESALSLDILASKGLIYRHSASAKTEGGTVVLSVICPTPLALSFVSSCRGDNFSSNSRD